MNLKILTATFKRNFIMQMRAYPKDFFIGNTLTGTYTVLSAYFMYQLLFKGNLDASFKIYSGTGDYMSYVIVGTALYLFAVRTCLNVSRSLITELREGTLDSLMIAPFNRVQYFCGNMLQQTITTSLEIMVMIIISLFFGANFSQVDIFSFIIGFIVSMFAYFSLSLVLAAIMLYFRDTYISQNTLFALMFLVCGVTFPIEYLPLPLQYLGKLIPVTSSFQVVRNSTIAGLGILEQANSFIYLILLSAVYCILGFKMLKKVEKIALEKIFA
jgi:ABC-2 type transport system permease protein